MSDVLHEKIKKDIWDEELFNSGSVCHKNTSEKIRINLKTDNAYLLPIEACCYYNSIYIFMKLCEKYTNEFNNINSQSYHKLMHYASLSEGAGVLEQLIDRASDEVLRDVFDNDTDVMNTKDKIIYRIIENEHIHIFKKLVNRGYPLNFLTSNPIVLFKSEEIFLFIYSEYRYLLKENCIDQLLNYSKYGFNIIKKLLDHNLIVPCSDDFYELFKKVDRKCHCQKDKAAMIKLLLCHLNRNNSSNMMTFSFEFLEVGMKTLDINIFNEMIKHELIPKDQSSYSMSNNQLNSIISCLIDLIENIGEYGTKDFEPKTTEYFIERMIDYLQFIIEKYFVSVFSNKKEYDETLIRKLFDTIYSHEKIRSNFKHEKYYMKKNLVFKILALIENIEGYEKYYVSFEHTRQVVKEMLISDLVDIIEDNSKPS